MALNLGVASGSISINSSDLKSADLALRSAGTSMVNFGQMAVGAFAAIVGEAAKFEKEMDFVQAVTGASVGEMEQLQAAALNLAKNSVYGPIELSKAFVELAKAGATAQQIIDGVGLASVQLATASDVAIPFAGENLINIMNTFKIGAEEASRVADLLAGSANASSVELQDLVISFKYAGPVAEGLGISIEDVSDALTILGKVGIKASTAGTSLRAIMLNLSPATSAAEDAMKSLGIITEDGKNLFYDAAGNAKQLSEVFEILKDKTKALNNEQKVSVLRDIFGVRAIPSALELLSQGEAGFKAINDEINRTTAADVAAKRMDNLDGSIKRLKATLSAMFVEAGGPFQEMLKRIVDGLRNFLLFIDALPGPVKTFIVALVGIVGVLSILAGVFLLTIGNIVRMVRVLAGIRQAFALFSASAKAATAANMALSGSFLLNPITLIIAAIVALIAIIVLLYFKVKGVRDFIDGLWQDMQAAWDGITKGFVDLYHTIRDGLGDLIDWFSKLPETIGRVWDAVSNFFTSLPGIIGRAISSAAKAVGGFFSGIGSSIARFFGSVFGAIGGAVSSAMSALGDFFSSLPGIIGNALGAAGSALRNFFAELPGYVGYALGFIIGRFIRIFLYEIPRAIIQGGLAAIRAVVGFVSRLPGIVYRFLRMIIVGIVRFGVEVFQLMFQIWSTVITTVIRLLTALPGQIIRLLTSIITWLYNAVPQFLAAAWQIGSGIFTAIWDFVSQIPGIVWNAFWEALTFIIDFVGDFGSAAADIGTSVFDGIIDFFISLPGRIVELLWEAVTAVAGFVGDFWNAAWKLGSNLWKGFQAGLFGSPHTKIEYAMWDMEANMKDSMTNLQRNMRTIQGMESRMPQLNAGLIGLPTAASAALIGNGGGTQFNQNAPLIGQATIRDDRDIVTLSRQLAAEQAKQARAKGRVG